MMLTLDLSTSICIRQAFVFAFATVMVSTFTDTSVCQEQEASSGVAFFESRIQPVLVRHCYKCHSVEAEELQAGLFLDSREGLRQGGDSGPIIEGNRPADSPLIQALRYDDLKMPPEGQLPDQVIADFERWVRMGVPDSRTQKIPLAQQRINLGAARRHRSLFTEVLVNVFQSHCIACHGKSPRKAGLDLRTRASMIRGGESGPALVPGSPEQSLVLQRIVRDEMPPEKSVLGDSNYVRRVRSGDIEQLRKWIARGAPNDEVTIETDGTTSYADHESHWAFKAPSWPELPVPRGRHLLRTPLDAFVLKKLEERGLTFNRVADRFTLIRRASFDLLGLPPEPSEVRAFLLDERPDAYDRLIDRLLHSPAYGERWGKYWLDAVGYADTHGKISRDQYRKYIWRYRDYVVRSHNSDKSYARFLIEQIAGDELHDYRSLANLTDSQLDNLIATGFLRTASDDTDELGFNFIASRMAVLNDQVDILSSAVLGLTLECARCHDHKFDPIPQRDYYRFSAIFRAGYDPYDWLVPNSVVYPRSQPIPREYQRYLDHDSDTEPNELARYNRPFRRAIAAARQELHKLEKTNRQLPERAEELRKRIADAEAKMIGEMRIHGITDMGIEPTPVYVLNRGEHRSPRARVEPGVPQVLTPPISYELRSPANPHTTGRRLVFARWLVQEKHPLTSRVIVNRIWQYHFGHGIVDTPGNFGVMGSRPTHPELLDWLALELERQNWSLKSLHRLIMTSAVYRQSSRAGQDWEDDPDNVYLSRFPMRRLDGEAIRDSVLKVSGRLKNVSFGPADEVERTAEGDVLVVEKSGAGQRRSIYLARRRSTPVTMLEVFDLPQLVPNCLQPTISTVPNQALYLWNSQLIRECAEMLGRRIATQSEDTAVRLRLAYLAALSRPPTQDELKTGSITVGRLTAEWRRHLSNRKGVGEAADRAIVTFCHVLLNSPEFIYLD